MSRCKVYFVGAGPGDPGLMTVKGAMLIDRADCIIYDGLANAELLYGLAADVDTVCVAKRSGHHTYTQAEINALIVEKAKHCKTIVRLKGGDPCLFGRAVEEIQTCIDAGLAFEVVPGITAGMAAAEYAGIFLTDRDHTSAVCFVTGREAEGKDHTDLDWDHLAGFNGSLVIYMGMGNLKTIAATLIEKGKSPRTPAAVIHKATYPQQRIVKASLAEIAAVCADQQVAAPAIVIIGESASGIDGADWLSAKPLAGRTVLMTRDAEGNENFAANLHAWGARPVRLDAIEIASLTETPPVQNALRALREFDWIVLTSANGVRQTFSALYAMGLDARAFADARIACIGSQTATALAGFGLNADYVPKLYTSAALAQGLIEMKAVRAKSILLLRSEIAPGDLPAALQAAGAAVQDVPVYTVRPRIAPREEADALINSIRSNRIDWLTFTSSSTVDSFFSQVDVAIVQASSIQIASIGPFTTRQLRDYGIVPDVEARTHTVAGVISAMAREVGHD